MAKAEQLYEVGDHVGLAVRFGDADQPFDPPTVLFRMRDPRDRRVELTYGRDDSVVRMVPGAYQVVVVATVPGRWHYRFVGTGAGAAAQLDGYFDVFDVDGPEA